jgi:sporulation protein YlmC with PRC-barrel domain
MKRTTTLKQAVLATLLICGTASWTGAQGTPGQQQRQENREQENRERYGQPGQQGQQGRTADLTRTQQGKPQKANKASNLIGMEVKNSQGEKLGKIEEIVLNLESGEVAYCVLTADAGLFQGENRHAVPLQAFQRSATEDTLILNANKEKLERAKGFSDNNWPSVDNPTWGAEPFWDKTPGMEHKDKQQKQQREGLTPGTPGYQPNQPR